MLKELLLYFCLRCVFLLRHRLDKGSHAFRLCRPSKNAVHRHARSGHQLSDPARNGNLRSLGHSVVHHFRRNLNPRFARYEKDTAPVPFQHPCEIVSREPHSALTFISKRRYQSASGISANGLGSKMPTLFTSTSTAGSFAITASAPAEPEKSAAMPSTFAAAAWDRIASTAASTRSCVRPFTWTCAPSLASDLAIANPIPAVDPVTRAIFPVSLRSTSFSCRKAAPLVVTLLALPQPPAPCPLPFPI